MAILKWAAVAVTALFVLMNLGAALDGDTDTAYRVAAIVLAILGAIAVGGLATRQAWGRTAVIGIGALNAISAITGLFTDQQGAAVGVVVGGLGIVLGSLMAVDTEHPATHRGPR